MNTRKYPRTLNEAYGPYHDRSQIYDEEADRMPMADKIVLAFCVGVAVAIVVMAVAGWLPGGVL